jgi:hypothetical protein
MISRYQRTRKHLPRLMRRKAASSVCLADPFSENLQSWCAKTTERQPLLSTVATNHSDVLPLFLRFFCLLDTSQRASIYFSRQGVDRGSRQQRYDYSHWNRCWRHNQSESHADWSPTRRQVWKRRNCAKSARIVGTILLGQNPACPWLRAWRPINAALNAVARMARAIYVIARPF